MTDFIYALLIIFKILLAKNKLARIVLREKREVGFIVPAVALVSGTYAGVDLGILGITDSY